MNDLSFLYVLASVFTVGSLFFTSRLVLAVCRVITAVGIGWMFAGLFHGANTPTTLAYVWSITLIVVNVGIMFCDYVVYRLNAKVR